MRNHLLRTLVLVSFCAISGMAIGQGTTLPKLNPVKVKEMLPSVMSIYGGEAAFNNWKKDHEEEYVKFMWYMTESYEIRRNYLSEGVTMDGVFDVRRFEHLRKMNEEYIVTFPHFKDVVVLLPASKLVYKP